MGNAVGSFSEDGNKYYPNCHECGVTYNAECPSGSTTVPPESLTASKWSLTKGSCCPEGYSYTKALACGEGACGVDGGYSENTYEGYECTKDSTTKITDCANADNLDPNSDPNGQCPSGYRYTGMGSCADGNARMICVPNSKSNTMWLIIGGVAAFSVIVIIIIVIMMKMKKNKSK